MTRTSLSFSLMFLLCIFDIRSTQAQTDSTFTPRLYQNMELVKDTHAISFPYYHFRLQPSLSSNLAGVNPPTNSAHIRIGPCNARPYNSPLMVFRLNGKKAEVPGDIDHPDSLSMYGIKPDWIELITVLKKAEDIHAYGDRGKYGVIIIDLKEDVVDKIPSSLFAKFKDQ